MTEANLGSPTRYGSSLAAVPTTIYVPRSAAEKSIAGRMTSVGIPYLTAEWLASLPKNTSLHKYGEVFAKHGYETTFAIAFVENEQELMLMGLWPDDAKFLDSKLPVTRNLVSHWTPALKTIPSHLTVQQWLGSLPLLELGSYTSLLASIGYESLASLRHCEAQDLEEAGVLQGHSRIIAHCAKFITMEQLPPACDIELDAWLMFLKPPMEHYCKALQLDGIQEPLDLCKRSKGEFSQFLMKVGHIRTLWHYTVMMKTFWYDAL